jgi:NADH-quinone oxidoreductase subunit J
MLIQALFYIFAGIAIVSALMTITRRNPVASALWLVGAFFALAAIYTLLGAFFIGIIQILVYAGAIMVLFLFVIMLLGAEQLRIARTLGWQQPLAVILAVVLVVEAGFIIFTRTDTSGVIEAAEVNYASPQAIGEVLFNQYLLPFEITSVLLLVAMIGAIVMTKEEKNREAK